jgi:hypothetical protein
MLAFLARHSPILAKSSSTLCCKFLSITSTSRFSALEVKFYSTSPLLILFTVALRTIYLSAFASSLSLKTSIPTFLSRSTCSFSKSRYIDENFFVRSFFKSSNRIFSSLISTCMLIYKDLRSSYSFLISSITAVWALRRVDRSYLLALKES